MEKSFVEVLWKKDSEQVKKLVSEVTGIEQENLKYDMMGNKKYCVRFSIIERNNKYEGNCILVTDFKLIHVRNGIPYDIVDEWVKFMYENCGKPYAMKYISRENQLYDFRRARDREETDEKIEGMLNKMGYFNDNGYTK